MAAGIGRKIVQHIVDAHEGSMPQPVAGAAQIDDVETNSKLASDCRRRGGRSRREGDALHQKAEPVQHQPGECRTVALPRRSAATASSEPARLHQALAIHSAPTPRASRVTISAITIPSKKATAVLAKDCEIRAKVDCSASSVDVLAASAMPIGCGRGPSDQEAVKQEGRRQRNDQDLDMGNPGHQRELIDRDDNDRDQRPQAEARMLVAGSSWAAKKEQATAAIIGAEAPSAQPVAIHKPQQIRIGDRAPAADHRAIP